MANRSTNPTWVDYPSTSTLVTATDLNNIETAINNSVVVAGDLGGTAAAPTVAKVNGVAVTGTPTAGQVPTASSGTAASWQTPAGGAPDFVALSLNTNQTYSAGTVTPISWDTEVEDTSGYHDPVTNPTRITVPTGKAGVFAVSWQLAITGTSITTTSMSVKKNGTTTLIDTTGGVSGQTGGFVVSMQIRLAAADYIELNVWTQAGSSLAMIGLSGTSNRTQVQVTRLGS